MFICVMWYNNNIKIQWTPKPIAKNKLKKIQVRICDILFDILMEEGK